MIVSRIRVRLLTWVRVRPAWCLACARVSPMGTHASTALPLHPPPPAERRAGGSLLPCPHVRRGTGLLRDRAGLNGVQGCGEQPEHQVGRLDLVVAYRRLTGNLSSTPELTTVAGMPLAWREDHGGSLRVSRPATVAGHRPIGRRGGGTGRLRLR